MYNIGNLLTFTYYQREDIWKKERLQKRRHVSIPKGYIEQLLWHLYCRARWLDVQAKKGVDAGSSSSAPYSSSETTTSQPENSNTENPSQNKKDDSAGKIDIEKNSIYYSENGTREGFTTFCGYGQYHNPGMADCSMYLCDGNDLVRIDFNNMDFTKETQGGKRMPNISDLLNKTDELYTFHDYPSTEITKGSDECKEKSNSVGQFTKTVSFPRGENEQYLCLPQFMTTRDGKKMGMKVTKTTSANKKDNDGPRYPFYTLDISEECFNTRFLD